MKILSSWMMEYILSDMFSPPVSKRYAKGIASYGKKVNSEKRKARIIAELNKMGVKPRVRRKMGRREVDFAGKRIFHWPQKAIRYGQHYIRGW